MCDEFFNVKDIRFKSKIRISQWVNILALWNKSLFLFHNIFNLDIYYPWYVSRPDVYVNRLHIPEDIESDKMHLFSKTLSINALSFSVNFLWNCIIRIKISHAMFRVHFLWLSNVAVLFRHVAVVIAASSPWFINIIFEEKWQQNGLLKMTHIYLYEIMF